MAFMTWTKEMSVGVTAMDDDHKKLIDIINELHDGIAAGHKKEVLSAVLDQLVDYTKFHFAKEEELMLKASYLAVSTQKIEHASFISRISNLQERFKSAPVAMLDLELMDFLRAWLFSHIRVSDKKYGPHLNDSGLY